MSVSRAQPGRESWVWAPDRRGQPCGGQCCCPECPGEHTEAGEGRGRAHRLLTQLFLAPPGSLGSHSQGLPFSFPFVVSAWCVRAVRDPCPLPSARPWPALALLPPAWKQTAVWTSATCSG